MKFRNASFFGLAMDKININMRCIEIVEILSPRLNEERININMRCIEIELSAVYANADCVININMRCIEIA